MSQLHYPLKAARIDADKPLGIHSPKLPGDVGFDLVAMETVTLRAFQSHDVPVNARLEIPEGVWAEIRARSSIVRRGLQVEAGVIDNGYRGPLFVLVRNMQIPTASPAGRNQNVVINEGERVGQLVLHRIVPSSLQEVPEIDVQGTRRGGNGFGSTGVA
jgi:dUTP pyrophosphatase